MNWLGFACFEFSELKPLHRCQFKIIVSKGLNICYYNLFIPLSNVSNQCKIDIPGSPKKKFIPIYNKPQKGSIHLLRLFPKARFIRKMVYKVLMITFSFETSREIRLPITIGKFGNSCPEGMPNATGK